MDWFAWDFDRPAYFDIYADKAADAALEGPALAQLLGLPPGSQVLDLPCGWGRLHPFLRDRGLRVVGGDLSPMNLARHRQERPAPLARLDLRRLPFRDGCADGVFCAFTSWGYFATHEENLRQLQEFARVLRPGGVLLLDLVGRTASGRTRPPSRGAGWPSKTGTTRSGSPGALMAAASSRSAAARGSPSGTTSGFLPTERFAPPWPGPGSGRWRLLEAWTAAHGQRSRTGGSTEPSDPDTPGR